MVKYTAQYGRWGRRHGQQEGRIDFPLFLNEAIAVPLSISNSIRCSRPFLHSSSLWLTSGMGTDFSEKIFGGCARPVPSPRHISGISTPCPYLVTMVIHPILRRYSFCNVIKIKDLVLFSEHPRANEAMRRGNEHELVRVYRKR